MSTAVSPETIRYFPLFIYYIIFDLLDIIYYISKATDSAFYIRLLDMMANAISERRSNASGPNHISLETVKMCCPTVVPVLIYISPGASVRIFFVVEKAIFLRLPKLVRMTIFQIGGQ